MNRFVNLTFGALRHANALRLPQFRNKHGAIAHAKIDGSDWSPAQWLQAVVGELGEYAIERRRYEIGAITFEEFRELAAKELADVQTYLDILARRCLDTVVTGQMLDPAQRLQLAIARIGEYANNRKKVERGDLVDSPDVRAPLLSAARAIEVLVSPSLAPTNQVEISHLFGVDLAQATVDKFNEVSARVGSSVRLSDAGEVLNRPAGKAGVADYLPHQQRAIDELDELGERIVKLDCFLSDDARVEQVDPVEITLMQVQLDAMRAYQTALRERCARFEPVAGPQHAGQQTGAPRGTKEGQAFCEAVCGSWLWQIGQHP